MTEIDPAELVRKVVLAYEGLIQEKEGNTFIHISMPRDGSKCFLNCLEVHDWALDKGYDLKKYFEAVLATYSPDWCMKTFRKPYPPFGVASSVKVLARLDAVMKEPAIKDDSDRIVLEIVNTIRKHPQENWNLILDNVYSYLPYETRAWVQDRLEGGV
mgnify:FL=1